MKRHSESAGAKADIVKVRRQEPISCQWCREKKSKCDRGSPCSNCRARNLVCSLEAGGHIKPVNLESAVPPNTYNMEEMNARLRRLEELLAEKTRSDDQPWSKTRTSREGSEISKHESPCDFELAKTATWLEAEAFKPTKQNSSDTKSTSDIEVADLLAGFVFSAFKEQPSTSFERCLSTILPSRQNGVILMSFYFEQINWIYYVIHKPTVRRIFDDLYNSLQSNQKPNYGHLALVSTICAISVYHSSPSAGLCVGRLEAMKYFSSWTLLAQQALAAADYLSHPTLETIQSLLLVSMHLMTNFGPIATFRTLSGMTLHMARTLSFHMVDSIYNRQLRQDMEVDWAELEVKRRVWWHIASSDWLFQFASGPLWGTYTVHPKQMAVNLPSNVEDDWIGPQGEKHYAQPPDVPTGVTFFLQRIKIAQTFREMIDNVWDNGSDIDNPPYDLVLAFDQKINSAGLDFDKKFSAFVSGDLLRDRENKEAPGSHVNSTPGNQLFIQWQMGRFGVHARLSRLHRPYLLRGAQDPQYAYSRMVCLRSTRTIIELGRDMMTTEGVVAFKIWCISHYLFVSATILILDYCFTRDEPRARERKHEILDCLNILEKSPDENRTAMRRCQHLRNILQEATNGSQPQPETLYPRAVELIKMAENSNNSHPVEERSPQHTVSITQLPCSLDPSLGSGSADVLPFKQWQILEFPSFTDVNFDVQLDTSLFEELFHDFDPSSGIL